MANPAYEKLPDGTFREIKQDRNQSGGYQSQQTAQDTPEARGKAAALDAYLARGGTPFRKSGRYKKGPNKGKNYDEAKAKFEQLWATASPEVKNKYASRSLKTDLAPIEKEAMATQAPQSAPIPQGSAKIDTGLNLPTRAPTFAELTTPPSAPEGGTNSIGDGQYVNGKVQTPFQKDMNRLGKFVRRVMAPDEATIAKAKEEGTFGPLPQFPEQSSVPSGPKPLPTQTPEQKKMASMVDFDKYDGKVRGGEVTDKPAPGIVSSIAKGAPALGMSPNSISQTPPPSTPAPSPTKPPTINSQTGLPMGYRPGDDTTGLDKSKVAESQGRIADAQRASDIANAPKARPVSPPTAREEYATATKAYRANEADTSEGAGAKDSAKFGAVTKAYNRGNSLEKAQMSGDTMRRAASLPTRSPGTAPLSSPTTAVKRPRFASMRR